MADDLKVNIVLESEQAQRALGAFIKNMERAGFSAEETAKEIDKFEKAYVSSQKQLAKTDALKTARNETDLFSSSMAGLTSTVMQYAGPAVVIAATKRSLEFADSVKTLSQQTKFSTDAVQTLGHVAKLAGSSFEAVANAASILDKNLSIATPKTERAIAALGLSIDDLLSMQPEDRFRAIGIAIGETADPAQRAELAMTLFGRAGAQLLPMFEDLARGAEENAPKMSSAWIEGLSQINDELDSLMARGMQVLNWFLGWPVVLSNWANQVGQSIREGLGNAFDPALLPNVPGRPNIYGSGGSTFDPLNGQSMGFLEGRLTRGAQSRRGGGGAGFDMAPYQFSGGTAAMFRGSLGFPGWAIPGLSPFGFAGVPFASGPTLAATPFGFTGAGFAPTVGMNPPNLGGGFGSWFRGTGGRMAGMGLGMLSGLLPGMSQTGSSLGSVGGSIIGSIGSLAGSALGSLLGPIGGIVGGLFGKLFGGGEGKKTNDLRDSTIQKDWGSVNALREAADKAGFSVDRLLSVKKIKDFEAEYLKLKQAIGDSEADAMRVEEAMARWGLTIQDMGPKFQQTKINESFKEAFEDMRVLTAAGADFNTVAEKMGPTIGAFIQEAIEMGGSVPRELEPILKKMIELGVLTDKNGDKFTELSQIPFASDLNKDFQTLIGKMDALIDKISRLPGLFDDATDAANDLANAMPSGGGGVDPTTPGGDGGAAAGVASPLMVAPTIVVQGYLDSPSAQRNLSALVRAELAGMLRSVRAA